MGSRSMSGFGDELTRLMEAREIGVRALGKRSGYSASYISQLCHGRRRPSPEAAQDLDDALAAGGELAACAPTATAVDVPGRQLMIPAGTVMEIAAVLSALPGQHQQTHGALRDQEYDHLVDALAHWAEHMKRRDVLAILGAAAAAACASPLLERLAPDETERIVFAASGACRADDSVVGHIEAVLDHCMRQEDALGPQIVLQTVLAQHHVVRSLLAGVSNEDLRARLLSLLANISRFTGWVLFNLNDFAGAEHYYAQARSAAHEADDDAMCSMVLANWSQLATWAGDPRLGVEHALGAVAWGQRAGSRLLVSYGCDVGARAYAAVVRRSSRGDRRTDHARCMSSLDQAHREFSEAMDGDPGAGLAYFYGDGQHLATTSRCLLDLDDPIPALAIAQQSLAVTDSSFVRNLAMTRLFQARAHAQMGDVDEACTQVAEATSLARRNSSVRLITAIAESRAELSPWEGSPEIAALDEQLRAHQVTGA